MKNLNLEYLNKEFSRLKNLKSNWIKNVQKMYKKDI